MNKRQYLRLDPNSQAAFNERARSIEASLTVNPQVYQDKGAFPIEPHVKATLTAEDVIPESSVLQQLDHGGEERARYFVAGNESLGLGGEHYIAFRRLSEEIQASPAFRGKVGVETVLNLLVDWLRARRTDQTQLSATDFVLECCAELVDEYLVIVPIFGLFIENPMEVGRVLIRTVTASEIDLWVQDAFKKFPGQEEAFRLASERWRKELQGNAAVTMTVTAEPRYAYELTRDEGNRALAMMRLFTPVLMVPRARSYWTLLGAENIENTHYYVVKDGHLVNGGGGWRRFRHSVGSLNSEQIDYMKRSGLDSASKLLRMSERSEFQQKLLEALLTYSHASLQEDVSEKLLYVVVALETILRRGRLDSIQTTLGERLAVTFTAHDEERRRVVRTLKKAYRLRSRFVHHGVRIDDLTTMELFLRDTWRFFVTLLSGIDRHRTMLEFIDFLDALRQKDGLAGGPTSGG